MDPVVQNPFLVPVYIAYAIVAVGLTVGLARVLFRSGAVFLEDVFKDTPRMAEAVNRLLVVGFYLLNLGYAARLGGWQLTGFGRVDNAFDRRYAGSVIVNEGNGRYFEPAPGRTWLLGTSASHAF